MRNNFQADATKITARQRKIVHVFGELNCVEEIYDSSKLLFLE